MEAFEHLSMIQFWNAGTVILHLRLWARDIIKHADCYAATRAIVSDRIVQKVADDLSD